MFLNSFFLLAKVGSILSLTNLVNRLLNGFKGFTNGLVKYISIFAAAMIRLLPGSPFEKVIESLSSSELLTSLDWAIPFSSFVAIGSAWTVSVGGFYIISVVLRWVKAIE